MKVSTIILAILILVYIGQMFYFYPQLPETIASHFDASGQANGFMTKNSFFAFETILLVFLTAMFSLIAKWLPKMPDSSVNLPNKDYWLAPERRAQTFAVFDNFFAWLNVAVAAMFVGINQIVLTANLTRKDPNPMTLWIVLGAFFALIIILIFVHLKQFFGTKTA